jgi:hypothetical protein
MNYNDELKLILFFTKELETNVTNKQIEALRILTNMSHKEARDVIKSGYMEMIISKEKLAYITKLLDKAEITYSIDSTESCEDEQKDEQKKVNFIVSKDILKKKKNEIVECIIISKEEYNELLKCKEIARDLMGSLRSLTKDFSIVLHNYIS